MIIRRGPRRLVLRWRADRDQNLAFPGRSITSKVELAVELPGKVKQRSCGLNLLYRDELTAAAVLSRWQIESDVVTLKDVLPKCRKRMFLSYLPSEADDT